MNCPSCHTENKENVKNCKRCGSALNLQMIWSPTWKWHAKALGIIYISLTLVYFLLNWFLKPYLRDIPSEVTPWLKQAQKIDR